MNDKPPRVVLQPRHEICRSHVQWDKDSLVLSLTLARAERDQRPKKATLAEKIDGYFGIEQGDYRIVLGEMDILLDWDQRMKSLAIRTNPSTWRPSSLLPIPGNPRTASVSFVADYDQNRIASYKVPIRILRDPSRPELSFVFGDFAASQWASIADGLVVGVTADGYLSELRLVELNVAFD